MTARIGVEDEPTKFCSRCFYRRTITLGVATPVVVAAAVAAVVVPGAIIVVGAWT